MGDSGMGMSLTSRAFVSSPSFPSFSFHLSLEGRLAPSVGLALVEGLASVDGLASVEGLASLERLDSLVSHDVASASVILG